MGPRDILAMVIRRRWVILSISLPIILVSAIATLRSAERLTASTRVMVIGKEAETPDFSRRAPNWDLLMSTSAQVAQSIPVAKLAAQSLFDTLKTIEDADPSFPRFSSVKELQRALLRGVDSNPIGESNLLKISFTHTNSHFALLAVTAITKAYIEFSIKSQHNMSAVNYYTDQINNLQQELDSLLAARADVYKEAGLSALDNPSNAMGQIRSLETAMINTRSQRVSLEAKVAMFRHMIEVDDHYIPVSSSNESMYFQDMQSRLNEMMAELALLTSKYKKDSPWVTRQQHAIDELWKTIIKQRDNYLRDLTIRIQELRSKEESYRKAIRDKFVDMKLYPDAQRRISSLDMQINAQLDLLEALQLKRGEVRLKSTADARISNLYELDEPHIETLVNSSKKILYLSVAFVFALTLGFAVGWFVDLQDHRIIDRVQAEHVLGVPVLGAITTDTTSEQT